MSLDQSIAEVARNVATVCAALGERTEQLRSARERIASLEARLEAHAACCEHWRINELEAALEIANARVRNKAADK